MRPNRVLVWGLLAWIPLARAWPQNPAPTASIVLTAQENGLDSQKDFSCRGTIHGYIRLPQRTEGEHWLESHWTSPAHKVAAESRDKVDFRPARSTAYVWFAFPERVSAPGALDPKLDEELMSYNGLWRLEVRWDDERIIRREFSVRCP